MKLEFLEKGSADCPLIRIYGTHRAEFVLLRDAIQRLANGGGTCAVDQLPGFDPVVGCALTLIPSSGDTGVRRLANATHFEWALTPTRWAVVAGLIAPFASNLKEGTHQWLAGKEARYGLEMSAISVLVSSSVDGRW